MMIKMANDNKIVMKITMIMMTKKNYTQDHDTGNDSDKEHEDSEDDGE